MSYVHMENSRICWSCVPQGKNMTIPRFETRHVLRKEGPWTRAFRRSSSVAVFRCEIQRTTPRSSMQKDCAGFGRMDVSSCKPNNIFLWGDTCMDDSSKQRIKPSSLSQETIPRAAWLLGLASLGWTCAGAEASSILSGTHAEPVNALSLPTWAVHTSSVIEWVVAMVLMWRYGEATGNQRWKGMTWGMLPFLASAMCACTWHFFYNNPELEFLVTLQAALTNVGNFTCWIAAYRIYKGAQEVET